MPDTQQQWLEEFFKAGWEQGVSLNPWQARELARMVAAAWPSSPQGQAVKALMEAAEEGLVETRMRRGDHECHNEDCQDAVAERRIVGALDAARKAGLDKAG